MTVVISTDRPMPDIARACVDALLAGQDVTLPAAVWRRPGLVKAITAEQQARGMGTGRWQFVTPASDDDQAALPDAGDILGWGDGPAPRQTRRTAREQGAAAAVQPTYDTPAPPTPTVVSPVVTAPTRTQVAPAPAVQRPVHINHPVVHSPAPTPPPVAPPVTVAHLGRSVPQTSAMMQAAYALIAFSQPVMAAGLRPGPSRQRTYGAPAEGRRWSAAQALAELAELDDL